MAFLTAPCPHPGCTAAPVRLLVLRNYRPPVGRGSIVSCCMCPQCGMPVSAILKRRNEFSAPHDALLGSDAYAEHDLLEVTAWTIKQIIPSRTERHLPPHVPADIASARRQAGAALARKQWETAAFLFRTALDRALVARDGGRAGSALDRIGWLAEAGRLPADLRIWASELPATSAEITSPNRESVTALAEFIDAFLLAAFTVPRMFELRHSAGAEAAA